MEPGAGYGGYVRLKEIAEKKVLGYKGKKFFLRGKTLYVDGRPVQGLKVYEDERLVGIKGLHFTAWEKATQIRSTWRIEPPLSDPYIYVAEPGLIQGWSEKEIKKELGAAAADTEVKLEMIVPLELVWIKATRKVAHFAIRGILSEEEIRKIKIRKRK